jgi:hypothetical protein
MQNYSVFGGCLRSEIPFPDLLPSPDASALSRPDWTLRVVHGAVPQDGATQTGAHQVGPWHYRLFDTATGLRLELSDDYVFELAEGGTEIRWYVSDRATIENVRALVLGPLLALAHHLRGGLCLHGSAVAVGEQGLAFLAGKHHGKSTLGLALALAGARHLTDDAVAVDLSSPLRLRPGIHSVRLWQDSADRFARSLECTLVQGLKATLTELPEQLIRTAAVPLAAVYMLRPVQSADATVAAERSLLDPSGATLAMICHTKLPQPLMGRARSGEQFQRVGAVARSVQVYDLAVARDFDRLSDVVEIILSWHG